MLWYPRKSGAKYSGTVQGRILEYAEAEGALLNHFHHLRTDIHGKPDYTKQTGLIPVHAKHLILVFPYIPK